MRHFRPHWVMNSSKLDSSDPSSPLPNLLSSSKPIRNTFFLRLNFVKLSHEDSRTRSQPSARTIAKRKRAKYAHVRPPPPLANELAMMQFADGGKLESHVKRVMDAQAKATAGSGGLNVGIGDVYRDEKGGIWWDADEEMEYAHLLDGLDRKKAEGDVEESLWEDFGCQDCHTTSTTKSADDRRPSVSSSVDSDLDPKYLLPSPEFDSYPTFTSGVLNDRILVSPRVGDESLSALSLPSHPSRHSPHLFKPILLGDMEAFGRNGPRYDNPLSLRPHSRGVTRRRLTPFGVATSECRVPHLTPPTAPDELQNLRKEFIESSFTPPASSSASFATNVVPSSDPPSVGTSKRPSSSLNVRALFTRKRRLKA